MNTKSDQLEAAAEKIFDAVAQLDTKLTAMGGGEKGAKTGTAAESDIEILKKEHASLQAEVVALRARNEKLEAARTEVTNRLNSAMNTVRSALKTV